MANSNPQVSLKQHYQEMPLYRFLWMILPLVLIPLGGLLGGIIGAVAAFGNFKLAEYDSLSGAKLYFLTDRFDKYRDTFEDITEQMDT
jgi:hypothetical protein